MRRGLRLPARDRAAVGDGGARAARCRGGPVSYTLGLPGKPDPALFLEAARRLEVPARDAAVVEDALAGVEAGRRGGFGLVVGVDRTGSPARATDLRRSGADLVVADVGELLTSGEG